MLFTHTFIHPYTDSCLTAFLPDRFSTGPAIPGAVSHQSGDYRTTNLPPRRAVDTHWALSECQYNPNRATTDTPGSPVRPYHRPVGYSRTTLSVHEFTITYSYMYPGFHRIAVLQVSGLFYSSLNYTQIRLHMKLPIYPPNTISNTYMLNQINTIYYVIMHTSVSLKTPATTKLNPVSPTHTSADIT